MEDKIIVASFKKTKFARTETQWRYNVGQKLQFEGIELPPTYEVHFSNSLDGTAKSRIGDSTGVSIPMEYFIPGSEIYAWIYLTDENTGITVRQVTIPIHQKARVTDQVPDPDEQSVIDETIAHLNSAIEAIPVEIQTALAAAKASGEFNGNNIWWTVAIPSNVPLGSAYYGLDIEDLAGREDVAPAVDDLVYAPPSSGTSHQPTCLYRITFINNSVITMALIGSLKGDQGFSPYVEVEPINHGHRVAITDEGGTTSFDVMDGVVGNMEADLQMNGYHIKNLAEGVADTDGVNKAQVLKMIGDGSGVFRGSFPSKAFLNSLSWQSTDPNAAYYVDNNDYAVILSDETQHYECWRYSYTIGTGWMSQYRINEAPMTAAQIDAINSGITASRLVALEQFKNAGQPKLDGIEAGAQVNDIEHIRVWDETAEEYVELPISNKTVDLPQSSGGSDLEIYWINATLNNSVITFNDSQNLWEIVESIKYQFNTLNHLPVIKLTSDDIIYALPLSKYHPGGSGQNSYFGFSATTNDNAIDYVSIQRRAGISEYSAIYRHFGISATGIGAIPAPSLSSNGDVLTYDGEAWVARAPGSSGGGLPAGGYFNQILRKNSGTDYDASWTDEKTEVIYYDFSVDEFGDVTTTADPVVIWSNIDTYGKAQYARVHYESEIVLLPLRAYQTGRIDFYGSVAPGITVMVRAVYDNDWIWLFGIDEITSGTFDYTELDNKPSINNVELDGALTGSDLGLGTYSKPSGGIPKTDLESAAQTSLGKADTAYQKPSGGIPKTDLASDVQTSLNKADTAIQVVDSTLSDSSVNPVQNKVITNALNQKSNVLAKTTSGSIASFTDGADDVPVKDLVISIEPLQSGSGDPSPTNVRPITGWTGANVTKTGVNIWDEEWEVGGYRTSDGEKKVDNSRIRSKNFIPVRPNTSYSFVNRWDVLEYGADKSYIGHTGFIGTNVPVGPFTTLTTGANTYYLTFFTTTSYGTTYNNDLCINYPASDNNYHPGNVTTIPIDWTSAAGTVYGGTLDVTTGILTVTHVLWQKNTSAMNNSESYPGWNPGGLKDIIGEGRGTSLTNLTGNLGTALGANTLLTNDIAFLRTQDYGKTQTEWIALAIDVQFVLPLATPLTYQLTPQEVTTLLGNNNIWADTGDITVNYRTNAVSDAGLGTYSKPSGGIPKSDLASDVQTSLGKADTALQSAPVTSVNSQTGAVVLSIPSTAGDVGAIAAPSSPTTGDFLVWNGSAWAAQSLSTWQGGNY